MRKVIEIGHGGLPFGNPLNQDFRSFARKFPPGVEYHGVDYPTIPQDPLKRPGQIVKNEEIAAIEEQSGRFPHPRIHFYHMDARALAFGDSLFHEAHIHNFVTDPRVSEDDIRAVLSEVRRVLVEGGVCLISGEKGRRVEPKWLATAIAIQDAGLSTIVGKKLRAITMFASDVILNHSFLDGAFIAVEKSGEPWPAPP